MLENRSFDQVLGCFKDDEKYAELNGIDREAPDSNSDSRGNVYQQEPSDHDRAPFDPKHEHGDVMEQIANRHAGFVSNFEAAYPAATRDDLQSVMNYFAKGALPAIHWLAENFTICDHWFSSVPGPTWTNRLFLLSGTSMGRVEMGSADNLGGLVGYNQRSIFDLLEDAGVPWRVYFHDFPQSLLLERQRQRRAVGKYCPIGVETDGDAFEADLRREGKDFPRFCFIEPQYFEPDQNDDHPTASAAAAQALIARTYNAIRAEPEVWKSSLLFVLYDEHGGFYDHAPIPTATAPAVPAGYPHRDQHEHCDFSTLGVRVPALLVSPWVGAGLYAEQLDHTSVLKYVSEKWNLPILTSRVEQANSIEPALLGTPREIPDARIEVTRPERVFAARPRGFVDEESDHQRALRRLSEEIAEEELGAPRAAGGQFGRVAQTMPGDAAAEMKQRTLGIIAAIKAKEGG
jgi:phospholipase C